MIRQCVVQACDYATWRAQITSLAVYLKSNAVDTFPDWGTSHTGTLCRDRCAEFIGYDYQSTHLVLSLRNCVLCGEVWH